MTSPAQIPLGPIMTSVSGVELTASCQERIMHPAIGGVVLFAENCKELAQISSLVAAIKALREPQLLVAVDQEGGRVQRITEGVVKLQPASRYGSIYDCREVDGCAIAELGGMLMALEVLQTGIDISFAPVVDVNNPNSNVIGDRALHSDPHTVALLAEAWTRGMHRAGMKAVGKHFPGHGGVSGDTHTETPIDSRNIHEVMSADLIPYKRLSTSLDAVMTAHVGFPEITSAIPTYSPFWLEHILREVLVFHGPVFSDDLTMEAAADAGDVGTRVLTALSSGCDFALVCQSEEGTIQACEELNSQPDLWKPTDWRVDELRPHSPDQDCTIELCQYEYNYLLDQYS